uniref:Peptidyl-prolyl cis-trans isomerase n=1 Tax=Eiseniibacteriota bacterium TaxID=2212470 RepID=A0A832HYY0_UNCEI
MRRLSVIALLVLAGCAGTQPSGSGQAGAPSSPASAGASARADATAPPSSGAAVARTLPGGLRVEDLKVGDGAIAEKGQTAIVHYTGWLTDGTKFDSSLDRDQPFSFRLGGGQVIRGWDEGVVGMRVGGKRKLTIPPDLGYGARAVGPIPPNSTLVFEVDLLGVR